jgi:hypothetical protein
MKVREITVGDCRVEDLTRGEVLPEAERYPLEACHTYAVTQADELPVTIA